LVFGLQEFVTQELKNKNGIRTKFLIR
jgi:hypothetical protein